MNATEKQIAYITDLLADIRTEMNRAARYAESGDPDANADNISTKIAALEPVIARIERGEYANTSAVIGALQKGVNGVADWGFRASKMTDKTLLKIVRYGLGVSPNFK